MKVLVGPDIQLYADCPDSGLNCTSTLFRSLRPDVVLIHRSDVYVIELTVPYETNCLIAKRRKEKRYRNLKEELMINCDSFDVITLEVTTLGFVSKGLIPRQRNSSRETVYAKYGWLGMNDSIEFSHFFRLRSE